MAYRTTFKKLIVTVDKEGKSVLRECVVMKLDQEGNLKTIEILRERPATTQEVEWFESGMAGLIIF
jgi:uncharacterized protein YuzE